MGTNHGFRTEIVLSSKTVSHCGTQVWNYMEVNKNHLITKRRDPPTPKREENFMYFLNVTNLTPKLGNGVVGEIILLAPSENDFSHICVIKI